MLALDTETTGVDFHHGALPFYVTTCDEDGVVVSWCWDVDPFSRRPIVPRSELTQIKNRIHYEDKLILHNAKFDVSSLNALFQKELKRKLDWPWYKTVDTLRAAHMLASNRPKDLTTLSFVRLRQNIEHYETRLGDAVKECRRLSRTHDFRAEYGTWIIADDSAPGMPSAKSGGAGDKDKMWKFDMWLPRAVAKAQDLPKPEPECDHDWDEWTCRKCKGHRWWIVLPEYSDIDPQVTIQLWWSMEREISSRKLTKIFDTCMKVHPIGYLMEQNGVTGSVKNLEEIKETYEMESRYAGTKCEILARKEFPGYSDLNTLAKKVDLKEGTPAGIVADKYEDLGEVLIAERIREAKDHDQINVGYDLQLPKSGANNSLRNLFEMMITKHEVEFDAEQAKYDHGAGGSKAVHTSQWDRTDTGMLSLNKTALVKIRSCLKNNSRSAMLVDTLLGKRSRDTAIQYMSSYQRFWIPLGNGYFKLYPSLNPTGTDTLRWSSNNPNEQNISKKEGFNLRYAFGPAPGREWWSCDAKNIELRLPAYEANERDMIALFEQPDEPPYYGSNHLLNFHTVYPDLWDAELKEVGIDKVGPYCKKKYASTYYQWCKNGGFAIQYNAGRITADRAFHRTGCFDLLKSRFDRLEAHNQWCIQFAGRTGYIETIPDRSVDPERGYPLMCTRTENGSILPTVPLSYRTQGSAMWWMMKAMIRCQEQIDEWNKPITNLNEKGYRIVMQVHDELVFDFPKAGDPKTDPKRSNLGRIRDLMKLMEESGRDFNIPTPTSCEYHPDNWSVGISV